MTLVLSFACHGIAVQVADRLVSLQRGSVLSPLDQIANKLIIYRARDAIVSIGYAGQAFIGGMPTDEWIAQLLSGEVTTRGPGEMGGVRLGRTANYWDIGTAVLRIRDNLSPQITEGLSVQISIVGHQLNRHNLVRPLVYEMTLGRNTVREFFRSPRNWQVGRGCVGSIGIEIGHDERKRILTHLKDAKPPLSSDEIAAFLTASIRMHAQPGIGPHTSAVILPFPGSSPVRSKFFPLTPHHILLASPNKEWTLETAYAPWIIGPGVIKPPSVEVGNSTYSVGGMEVLVEGSNPPASGIMSLMDVVPRLSWP